MMSLKRTRNLYLTTVPSNTASDYSNISNTSNVSNMSNDSNEEKLSQPVSKYRDSYKQLLMELNNLQSPKQLFYDIDSLFLGYSSLKRQYYSTWQTQQLYKHKIHTFLYNNNSSSTN